MHGLPSKGALALERRIAAASKWVFGRRNPLESEMKMWCQGLGAGVAVAAPAARGVDKSSNKTESVNFPREEVESLEVNSLLKILSNQFAMCLLLLMRRSG